MNALLVLIPALLGAFGTFVGYSLRSRAQNQLDIAGARKADAQAESLEVATLRSAMQELREEMERRVSALTKEVGRVQGYLEHAIDERDQLRRQAAELHAENVQLRNRVADLEAQVRILTTANELSEASKIAGPALDPKETP